MRFLTVEQMRAAEQAAIRETGKTGAMLMTRAGAALARIVERLAATRGARRVILVAGNGNNGGDACVAARCLAQDGYAAQVIMTCVPAALRGDAREAWDEMRTAGVPYVVLSSEESWDEDPDVASGALLRQGVVVDGILGTGCRGAPKGAAAKAIRWINRMREHALVVSADLPSGMDGDTGATPGPVARADVTVTFARPKRCFLHPAAAAVSGHLLVADIGIPGAICDRDATNAPCELIALPEIASRFQARPWHAHKGACGRVGVIGGSPGLSHAPVLAALGALRAGAGLATLFAPAASVRAAAALTPEAMAFVAETATGNLALDVEGTGNFDMSKFDALVVGPGWVPDESGIRLVARLLDAFPGCLTLDAGGLDALAALKRQGWQPRAGLRLAVTPHPGEAARWLGTSVEAVQADRLAAVRHLADTTGGVAALKGAGTLVCEPGGAPRINLTGNPGMAAGGMGDLLAGMIGARSAAGQDVSRAVDEAVWAHGAAGDLAAFEIGQTALCATDLAARLGPVFQMIERHGDGNDAT